MKIRSDFVTNSSSSSFIIGLKDDLTKEKLMQVFNVGKDSIFYNTAEEMVEFIIGEVEEMSLKELLEEWCEEDISELPEDYQKVFKKGLRFYKGSASNEGEAIENVLCDMIINYESDDFVFYKNGGY